MIVTILVCVIVGFINFFLGFAACSTIANEYLIERDSLREEVLSLKLKNGKGDK